MLKREASINFKVDIEQSDQLVLMKKMLIVTPSAHVNQQSYPDFIY